MAGSYSQTDRQTQPARQTHALRYTQRHADIGIECIYKQLDAEIDIDRHTQRGTERDIQRHTETYRDIQRQTDSQRQTETNIDRQRHSEPDRDRHRQT